MPIIPEEVPHEGAKVYAYTRVSTVMQVDGYSLDAQKKEIEKEAAHQGMKIVGEYCDEGKSGKDIKGRPDFQRMMEDIRNKKDNISFVLVFKLSRFGRNTADILTSVSEMKKYGVHLICVKDNIDSSVDSGKLMIAILGAMSEIERDNILVQTMAGRMEKARQGLWNGGVPPYGYRCVEGKLEVVPEEAEIVKKIFTDYANTTLGPIGLANWLNDRGYTKKSPRTHERSFFTREFISKMLRNPVYLGHMAYGRTQSKAKTEDPNSYHRVQSSDYLLVKNTHNAIISQGLWDTVQYKTESRKGKKEKVDPSHEYLLSGLLKCPCCGKTMYGAPMKKGLKKDGTPYPRYYSYACRPTISDRKLGNTCKFGQISCKKLDEPIRDIVMALVNIENFGEKFAELAAPELSTTETQRLIDTTQEQLRQAYKKQQNAKDARRMLDMNDDHYDSQFQTLTEDIDFFYDLQVELGIKLADAEAKLESIKKEALSRDSIYASLLAFNECFDVATDAEKKKLLHEFISGIELYPEKAESMVALLSLSTLSSRFLTMERRYITFIFQNPK